MADTDAEAEERLKRFDEMHTQYETLNERYHQIMLRASGLAVVTASVILSFGELFEKAQSAAKVLSLSVLFCGMSGCIGGVAAYLSLSQRAQARRLYADQAKPLKQAMLEAKKFRNCSNKWIRGLNALGGIAAIVGVLLFGSGVCVAAFGYQSTKAHAGNEASEESSHD